MFGEFAASTDIQWYVYEIEHAQFLVQPRLFAAETAISILPISIRSKTLARMLWEQDSLQLDSTKQCGIMCIILVPCPFNSFRTSFQDSDHNLFSIANSIGDSGQHGTNSNELSTFATGKHVRLVCPPCFPSHPSPDICLPISISLSFSVAACLHVVSFLRIYMVSIGK